MTHIYDSYTWYVYFSNGNLIRIYMQAKILRSAHANFFFLQISRKCVGGKFFWLKIWNQHKISHRMIYIDIRFVLNFLAFWKNNSLYAYAFRKDIKNAMKFNTNLLSLYIIRCEILCWFQIFSQKNFLLTHFRDICKKRNLRGRISKFLLAYKSSLNFISKNMHIMYMNHIYES